VGPIVNTNVAWVNPPGSIVTLILTHIQDNSDVQRHSLVPVCTQMKLYLSFETTSNRSIVLHGKCMRNVKVMFTLFMRVTLLGIFDENIKQCKWSYKDLKTFDYKCISNKNINIKRVTVYYITLIQLCVIFTNVI
jgi:hypothetical protein